MDKVKIPSEELLQSLCITNIFALIKSQPDLEYQNTDFNLQKYLENVILVN